MKKNYCKEDVAQAERLIKAALFALAGEQSLVSVINNLDLYLAREKHLGIPWMLLSNVKQLRSSAVAQKLWLSEKDSIAYE